MLRSVVMRTKITVRVVEKRDVGALNTLTVIELAYLALKFRAQEVRFKLH